jgi:hypothetical protein
MARHCRSPMLRAERKRNNSKYNNTVVAEPQYSIALTPKAAIVHYPESVPYTIHPDNLIPKVSFKVILPSSCLFSKCPFYNKPLCILFLPTLATHQANRSRRDFTILKVPGTGPPKARTLGWWVRIQHELWMYVRVFYYCAFLCR